MTHLALAALGVGPVLVLHLPADAHQVGLHDLILDAVQALLADVSLLAGSDDGGGDCAPGPAKSQPPFLIPKIPYPPPLSVSGRPPPQSWKT